MPGDTASPVLPGGNPAALASGVTGQTHDAGMEGVLAPDRNPSSPGGLPSLEELIRTWPAAALSLGLQGSVPGSLNPAFMQAGQGRLVAALLHQSVFWALDEDPSSFDPDGRTCRFKIKKGLVWPDGVLVTRDGILESWKVIYANPDSRSSWSGQLSGFSFSPLGTDTILVTAPHAMYRNELRWRLDVPLFPLNQYQKWRKLPNKGTLGTGLRSPGDLRYFWRRDAKLQDMLFAGTYRVFDWGPDSLVLQRNEGGTRQEDIGPKRLELRFYPEAGRLLTAFSSGQVDAVFTDPANITTNPMDSSGRPAGARELVSAAARVIVCRPGSAWDKAGVLGVLKVPGQRQGLHLWDTWKNSRVPAGTARMAIQSEVPARFPGPGVSLPESIRVLAGKGNPAWLKVVVRQFALIWKLKIDWAEPEWDDLVTEFRFGKTWDLALLGLDESRPPEDILPLLEYHDPEGMSGGRYPGPDAWPGDWAEWAAGPDSVMTLASRSRQFLYYRLP